MRRLKRLVTAARTLALLFITAVAVNYPWELAQAPLFEWPGESGDALWHCFVASVGDAVLVLLIFAAGLIALRRWDWFERPGVQGYLVMLVTGFAIAIAVEWMAVHVVQRWTYAAEMPRIPGVDLGIVPIVQMLILPPLIFRIVTAVSRRMR